MSAIFITATGTDVGKTYVAAVPDPALAPDGPPVDAIKPVVSGFDPAQAAASDPGVLLNALGLPVTAAGDRPDFAVALSRRAVAGSRRRNAKAAASTSMTVINFCQTAIDQRRDILLIEGVGGIMVPLDGERTMLDVMMALQLPLILVAGSYLGTISHTLTALDALLPARHACACNHRQRNPGFDRAPRRHGCGHRALCRTGHWIAAPRSEPAAAAGHREQDR